MEDSKRKNEAIRALSETLQNLDEISQAENLIVNNMIEFEHNNTKFRVRKPNPMEKREANDARRKKYMELLQDKNYLLQEQWIEVYKEKGINIDKLDEEYIELQNKQESLYLKLAKSEGDKEIEGIKEEILKYRDRQCEISQRKAELLQYSLENTLENYIHSYIAYLVTEKKEEGEWKRVYEKYDNFINEKDEKFFTMTMHFLSVLLLSENE